jgi:hypothetical protein
MTDVPSGLVAKEQAKLRCAITDIEEYCRTVPPGQRDTAEQIIHKLQKMLCWEQNLIGPRP